MTEKSGTGKIPSMTYKQALERVRKRTAERAAGMTDAEKEQALEEMARKWGHSAAGENGSGAGKDGVATGSGNAREKGSRAGKADGTTDSGNAREKQRARKREKRGPEAPPKVPEKDRTPPNKWENHFMIDLMVLRNAIATRGEKSKERLKRVNKHAARDLGLLFHLIDKIQLEMVSTMPESRNEYYTTLARRGRYHLDIDGPIRQGHTVLITDTNLGYLLEVAIEQECLMCLRDGSEIRDCPLRKALIEVSPAMDIKTDPGERCEYRNVHRALINGEDVTI